MKEYYFPVLLLLWAVMPLSAARGYWIPPDVDTLRGVFLQQNGLSSLGSSAWMAFATEQKFAIIAGGGDITNSLPQVFQQYADQSGHPEFAHLPICAWGGSMGGWWSMQVADKYPERVIAVVGGHSGIWRHDAGVPTLFTNTEFDPTFYSQKPIEDDFEKAFYPNRSKGAQWTAAVAWGGKEHGVPGWDNLVIAFFKETIPLRLDSAPQKYTGLPRLRPIALESGYLSLLEDSKTDYPAILPYDAFTGNKSHACWFPTLGFGRSWRAFVSGLPQAAPLLPTPLRLTQAEVSAPGATVQSIASTIPEEQALTLFSGDRVLAKKSPKELAAGWSYCLPAGISALHIEWTDKVGRNQVSPLSTVFVNEEGVNCRNSLSLARNSRNTGASARAYLKERDLLGRFPRETDFRSVTITLQRE